MRGESCDVRAMFELADEASSPHRARRRRDPALGARVPAARAAVAALREINRLVALEAVAEQRGPGARRRLRRRLLVDAARHDDREIYGIDISAREIAQARTRIHADADRRVARDAVPGHEVRGDHRQLLARARARHRRRAVEPARRGRADGARLLMFVPTPRWALPGPARSRSCCKRAPRVAMAIVGRAQRLLPALAPLRREGVDAPARAERLARARRSFGLGSARSRVPVPRCSCRPRSSSSSSKKLTGFYPSKLARFLPDAALAPLAKLVRWAVSDPLVPADSPHAYEYLIVAERRMTAPQPDYFANHATRAAVPVDAVSRAARARPRARSSRASPTSTRRATCSSSAAACCTRSTRRRRACASPSPTSTRARSRRCSRASDPRIVAGHVVAPEQPIDAALGTRFAAIYAKEVVEHVLAWPAWLAGLRRALVPGGRLWLSTPNYGEPWLPALESTVLELVARRSGFSRRAHPPDAVLAPLARARPARRRLRRRPRAGHADAPRAHGVGASAALITPECAGCAPGRCAGCPPPSPRSRGS